MSGLLFEGQIEKPVEKALEIGARQIAVRGDLVTARLLKEARERDLQVVCWTVNQPAHLRLLAEAGVDGIMSDYPDRLVELTRREDGAGQQQERAGTARDPHLSSLPPECRRAYSGE